MYQKPHKTPAAATAKTPKSGLEITDVQWVLGHAHLSITQLYLTAPDEDVIAAVVAHHARQHRRQPPGQDDGQGAGGYRPESLSVLFGREPK